MQELQPIPGLAGRLFDGALLRRHGGSPAAAQREAAAEVRCPRCGSANTKFCYYNNYNLAQPRHLCRACRRYWTKGGHLRNVPVGGACRKTKRPAAADGSGIHGARRDGKAPRHGCAGAATSSSSSPAADGDAISRIAVSQASRAFCVVTEPSGATSRSSAVAEAGAGAGSSAAGDAGALPLVPPPAPMFTDQAAVFASLFAPPRPLPAFGYSAPQKPEEEHVAGLLAVAAERQPPASSAAAGEGMVPFAARSDGALAAGASSDWPTAVSDDGGIFGLSGGIAGDASLPAYWKTGSWTDTDTTVYLP